MIPWNIQIAITNLTGYGSSMGFIKGGWKIEHDTYRIPRNYFKPTTKQPQNNKTSIPKLDHVEEKARCFFDVLSLLSLRCFAFRRLRSAASSATASWTCVELPASWVLMAGHRPCMFIFFSPWPWVVKDLKLNGSETHKTSDIYWDV